MDEARILVNEISHPKNATTAVNKNPIGMLVLAGIRKPTNRMATTKMGRRARNDNNDKDIWRWFEFLGFDLFNLGQALCILDIRIVGSPMSEEKFHCYS